MRIALVYLVLLVSPLARAQGTGAASALDSAFAAIELPDAHPIIQMGIVQDTLNAYGQPTEWVGLLFDSNRDPEAERGVVYALRPDTTVWVRTADGASVVIDAVVAEKLGKLVSKTTEFGDSPEVGLGWGMQDGRIYVYASQGIDLTLAIALGVLGLGLIGVAVFRLVRALRRSEARERLGTEARRQLSSAREEERLRIARDIHDGPIQDLHALRLRMGPAADDPPGRDVLNVIHGLKAISENLRPPALALMGFEAAIGSLVGRYEETHPHIAVSVDVEGARGQVPELVGLALFRVVQEAMNNASRHSGAGEVEVRIVHAPDAMRVSVEDDGSGFEVPMLFEALGAGGHYGLMGMAERVESVGGTLELKRRAEGGTRVTAEVPVTWQARGRGGGND